MTTKVGSIIDYKHPGSNNVSAGQKCAMLVTALSDDTVSGVVFLPDGKTEYVTTKRPKESKEK